MGESCYPDKKQKRLHRDHEGDTEKPLLLCFSCFALCALCLLCALCVPVFAFGLISFLHQQAIDQRQQRPALFKAAFAVVADAQVDPLAGAADQAQE